MFSSKKLLKRIGAGAIAIVMTLSLVAAGIDFDTIEAKADGVVVATITYTAQYDGSFKDVKLNTTVSSDTAENYGYADPVSPSNGVSMLDVLVQIHKDIFPEYTAVNKEQYLAINDAGWITNAFAKGGSSCGYYRNRAMAYGIGDKVNNNDVVDTFYYQDATGWSDSYTLFKDVNIEDGYLSGKLYKQGYDNNYNVVEVPLSNVELGFVNPDTLEIVPVSEFNPTKTGEDGSFSVELPNISINYYLTVLDGTYEGTPLVRTLCDEYSTTSQINATAKSLAEKQDIYGLAGKYLADTNKNISYGDNKEGYLLGLGRAGYPVDANLYLGYYNSVKNYLASHNNRFESVTECAKVVVALNAIGYDPTNIDGVNITGQLNEATDDAGVYGYTYALIGLDTKGYESSVRETYIAKILKSQLDNGAWGWNGTSPDIDTTGMVLAALAPYYNNNASVKAAVDKSLEYLSAAQLPDGTFASGMNENSNSTARVLLGLSELGIDVDSDSRFIKNGISVVDALCSFAVEGGGFGWTDNIDVNDLATYQSYYALCSYFRHKNGMNRLFDMTPERNAKDSTTNNGATTKVTPPKTGDKIFFLF